MTPARCARGSSAAQVLCQLYPGTLKISEIQSRLSYKYSLPFPELPRLQSTEKVLDPELGTARSVRCTLQLCLRMRSARGASA